MVPALPIGISPSQFRPHDFGEGVARCTGIRVRVRAGGDLPFQSGPTAGQAMPGRTGPARSPCDNTATRSVPDEFARATRDPGTAEAVPVDRPVVGVCFSPCSDSNGTFWIEQNNRRSRSFPAQQKRTARVHKLGKTSEGRTKLPLAGTPPQGSVAALPGLATPRATPAAPSTSGPVRARGPRPRPPLPRRSRSGWRDGSSRRRFRRRAANENDWQGNEDRDGSGALRHRDLRHPGASRLRVGSRQHRPGSRAVGDAAMSAAVTDRTKELIGRALQTEGGHSLSVGEGLPCISIARHPQRSPLRADQGDLHRAWPCGHRQP